MGSTSLGALPFRRLNSPPSSPGRRQASQKMVWRSQDHGKGLKEGFGFRIWPWCIWGFPEMKGTFLGVPIIRTVIFWGLYWGSPIWGNYHMVLWLHALPRCFTCRAKRPFWHVGAITRYASNLLSLLSICLMPAALYLYSWAVYSAYVLRTGRDISKLISNQYLRGCPLRKPLVHLILSLQPGTNTTWCIGSSGGFNQACG